MVLICCDGRGSPVAFRPAWGLARLGREGEVSFRRKLSSSSSSPPFKSLSLFAAIAALLSGFCCTRAEDKVLVQYSYIFSHLLKLGLAESAALRPPRLAPICREASRHHVRPARRGHRGHSVSVTCHGAAADPASPRCRLTAPRSFGDVHYFYGPPEDKPPHHRFDKGSYVYLFEDINQLRARIEIANQPGHEDQDAFDGCKTRTPRKRGRGLITAWQTSIASTCATPTSTSAW